MENTAIASETYAYNVDPATQADGGNLDYGVRISQSPATADHQHQRINSSAYEPCAIATAKETFGIATSLAGPGAYLDGVGLKRQVRNGLPVAYVDYLVTGQIHTIYGTDNTSDDTIFLQHGAARIRLEFFDCGCKLGPPPDKDGILNAAASALAKSSTSTTS